MLIIDDPLTSRKAEPMHYLTNITGRKLTMARINPDLPGFLSTRKSMAQTLRGYLKIHRSTQNMLHVFLYLAVLVLITSCATTRSGRVIGQGEASWYGPGFHGRQTANGETYDQNSMTAAHRTLPFNTIVHVINLDNGKSVNVRINDRGPYVANRIIDLSRAAAERIDMIDSGIAPVRLVLVRSEEPIRTRGPGNITREEFTIQLASFNTRSDAEAYSRQVRNSRVVSARVDGRTVYRVYFGRYRSPEAARNDLNRLIRRGHEGFIRQLQN